MYKRQTLSEAKDRAHNFLGDYFDNRSGFPEGEITRYDLIVDKDGLPSSAYLAYLLCNFDEEALKANESVSDSSAYRLAIAADEELSDGPTIGEQRTEVLEKAISILDEYEKKRINSSEAFYKMFSLAIDTDDFEEEYPIEHSLITGVGSAFLQQDSADENQANDAAKQTDYMIDVLRKRASSIE